MTWGTIRHRVGGQYDMGGQYDTGWGVNMTWGSIRHRVGINMTWLVNMRGRCTRSETKDVTSCLGEDSVEYVCIALCCHRCFRLNDLEHIEVIGQGFYGSVYKVRGCCWWVGLLGWVEEGVGTAG